MGGYRESFTVQLFIAPKDSSPSIPGPTVILVRYKSFMKRNVVRESKPINCLGAYINNSSWSKAFHITCNSDADSSGTQSKD